MKKIGIIILALVLLGALGIYLYRLDVAQEKKPILLASHCKDLSVVMFMSPYCKYCTMAKEILDKYGIEYRAIDVHANQASRERMSKITGQNSVPQIFIEGKHIGGYSHLKELDDDGKMQKFLQTCDVALLPEFHLE